MNVDLLACSSKGYEIDCVCLKGITAAFKKLHIPTRLIHLDQQMGEYLLALQKKPPTCALTFSNPLEQKNPLSDLYQLPTFHWEIRPSPSQSIHFIESKKTHVGYHDASFVKKIGSQGMSYFPPGVDPQWLFQSQEFLFDTVCFEPLIDRHALKEKLRRLFSEEVCRQFESVIELENLQGISKNDAVHAFFELEKSPRIQTLVESFSTKLSLFGEHIGMNWLKRLPNSPLISLHSALPFSEHFEVLKKSKLLLVDTPTDYEGLPFWFLVAPLCGALPLIPTSPVIEKLWGRVPFCYDRGNFKELNERVSEFLKDETKRKTYVEQLRALILERFSWEKRVEQWIESYANF